MQMRQGLTDAPRCCQPRLGPLGYVGMFVRRHPSGARCAGRRSFLLNKYARYLVFGMLAVALSLSWGYTGILNLGQAVTFGLGSYCMAMALKLRTIPVQTGAGGLPDFMVWNNVQSLPWFWEPFHSYDFAIAAGIVVPAVLALLLGWFMFRARVTGVYVAIITLAMLVVVNLLIIDQQRFTGGFNGITDLAHLTSFGVDFDAYSRATYYLIAAVADRRAAVSAGADRTARPASSCRRSAMRRRGCCYFGYDVAAYQDLHASACRPASPGLPACSTQS